MREMLGRLEAVDQRITPQHVAHRFRELLDDVGDGLPSVPGGLAEADGGFADSEAAHLAHVRSAEAGYHTSTAASVVGVTPGQLAYWARTGLIKPSVRAARGSGARRLYNSRDVLVLKVVKRLLDTGISLRQIRVMVGHLRDHGTGDLTQVTLMSDGVTVYECTSPDQIVGLLASGLGVYGIALGRVWQEVARDLAELPAAQAVDNFQRHSRERQAPTRVASQVSASGALSSTVM